MNRERAGLPRRVRTACRWGARCAALGLVTTLVVAWVCSFVVRGGWEIMGGDRAVHRRENSTRFMTSRVIECGGATWVMVSLMDIGHPMDGPGSEERALSDATPEWCRGRMMAWIKSADVGSGHRDYWAFGWPWPAAWWYSKGYGGTRGREGGLDFAELSISSRPLGAGMIRQKRMLPFMPVWSGLAKGTAFYGAGWGGLALVFALVRAWRRGAVGRCRECGYDLSGTEVGCPECGAGRAGVG